MAAAAVAIYVPTPDVTKLHAFVASSSSCPNRRRLTCAIPDGSRQGDITDVEPISMGSIAEVVAENKKLRGHRMLFIYEWQIFSNTFVLRKDANVTEPDVTLTDYGLTLLCSWFAWILSRQATESHLFRILWTIFFLSIAAASLTGGTVHGFFLDESTLGYRILWPVTLLAIGITAASAWILTGLLLSKSNAVVQRWSLFAGVVFIAYAVVVIFFSQQFLVVILNYLPAMIALLAASIRQFIQTRTKSFLFVIGGILVSFAAAYVQQAGIGIHPNYFNHNSTYHLIQAFGLLILFKGAKGLIKSERIVQ
jgi:hypothetical protein